MPPTPASWSPGTKVPLPVLIQKCVVRSAAPQWPTYRSRSPSPSGSPAAMDMSFCSSVSWVMPPLVGSSTKAPSPVLRNSFSPVPETPPTSRSRWPSASRSANSGAVDSRPGMATPRAAPSSVNRPEPSLISNRLG